MFVNAFLIRFQLIGAVISNANAAQQSPEISEIFAEFTAMLIPSTRVGAKKTALSTEQASVLAKISDLVFTASWKALLGMPYKALDFQFYRNDTLDFLRVDLDRRLSSTVLVERQFISESAGRSPEAIFGTFSLPLCRPYPKGLYQHDRATV